MKDVEVGKTYRHFKGGLYIVEGEAISSDTLCDVIIYRALYGEYKLWVRDKEEFLSEVGERPNGDNATGQRYRFERIDL